MIYLLIFFIFSNIVASEESNRFDNRRKENIASGSSIEYPFRSFKELVAKTKLRIEEEQQAKKKRQGKSCCDIQ